MKLLVTVLAVVALASVLVLALPSGNVIHSFPGGYWSLDSVNGFSEIAESYTTGMEGIWDQSVSDSASRESWNPDDASDDTVKAKLKAKIAAHVSSGTSSWTISAWVYVPAYSGDFGLFTFGPENICDGENGVGFFSWTGPLLLSMSSCDYDGTQGTTEIVNGWHHIAVSHGGSNSPVTVAYLDGMLEFSSSGGLIYNPEIAFIAARTADTSSNDPLKNAAGNFYLDDLRIWSRALTQAEVQFDKHGGAVKLGLIGNYDGSRTSSGELRDLAKSNHATRQDAAATYTTTAICPVATYIASCGTLSCRNIAENTSIPMCGPCLAGYHSTVLTNLSANCALDTPNPPTSPSVAVAGSKCLTVSWSAPVISAAISSYTVKYGTSGSVTVTGTSTTICGLTVGRTYTFSIRATNAAGTGAAVSVTGVPVSTGSSGCRPGHYLPSGATACVACAPGSYSTVATATVCDLCAIGTYAYSSGHSTCSICPIGHYGDSTGESYCHSCARGKYGAAAGITVCHQCSKGSYTAVIASTVCDQCAAGTYQPYVGRSECNTCSKASATVAGASTCA